MAPSLPLAHPFHAAAQEAAPITLAALLGAGVQTLPGSSLNEPGPEGASLLARCLPMSASEQGELILSALLAAGADPLQDAPLPQLPEGRLPFSLSPRIHSALANGEAPLACPAELSLLFPHPAALAPLAALPPERLRWLAAKRDALSCAAASGSALAIELLAGAGADLNAIDSGGSSALARCRSAAPLRALLDLGADLGTVSPSSGKNALDHFMSASGLGAAGREILALVTERALARPPAVAAPSFGPELSPAQNALASAAFTALASKNASAARSAMLSLGPAAAAVVKPSGETLLLAACRAENWAEANRLIAWGCDMCAMDQKGDSPLLLLSTSRGRRYLSLGERQPNPFYDSRGAAIALKWANSRAGGAGGSKIPWERLSPKGQPLIESFLGRLNVLGDFFSRLAPWALDRGWNPGASLNGSPPFLLTVLMGAAAPISRRHYLDSGVAGHNAHIAASLAFFQQSLPLCPPADARRILDEALADEALVQALCPSMDRYGNPTQPVAGLPEALLALAGRSELSEWAPPAALARRNPSLASQLEKICLLPPRPASPLQAAPRI